MKFIRAVLFVAAGCCTASLHAQGVEARVFADTTAIRIGERIKLHLELTVPAQTRVQFPAWSDTLDGFEIAAKGTVDTVDNGNNTFSYKQILELTHFDSGFYVIQPIPLLYKGLQNSTFDTVRTEALLLTVNTLPVDTTRSIRDIKPPMEVPFTFRDLLPYLAGAAVVAVLVYLLVRLLRKREKATLSPIPRGPVIPAHVAALKALQALAEEKLWQQGFYKQYYTRLTDIVRLYIEKRFEVLAMEQTTEEIVHALERNVGEEVRQKLGSLLRLADLVKFAKVHPVAHENEDSLAQAREFIHLTQPVVPAPAESKEEKA